MSKKILIVVDYQRDFVNPKGALPVPGAESISEQIQKEINNPIYDEIIYTLDTHTKIQYKNSEEAKLFPEHCIFNTRGWTLYNIVPRTPSINRILNEKIFKEPVDFSVKDEFIFVKNKFSIWEGNSHYANFISKRYDKKTEFVICGVATNYCVFENAIGYHKIGFHNVSIIQPAVKHIDDDTYNTAVNKLIAKNVRFIRGTQWTQLT